MLWVSSLRRIAHSTSLRATGSPIVFCRSAAWGVFPLRAAAIASFKAAMSAADGKSLGASADRVGRAAGWGAASGVRGVMPAFAGAVPGRGWGWGAHSASACQEAGQKSWGRLSVQIAPAYRPAAIPIPADHHPRPRRKGGGEAPPILWGGLLVAAFPHTK